MLFKRISSKWIFGKESQFLGQSLSVISRYIRTIKSSDTPWFTATRLTKKEIAQNQEKTLIDVTNDTNYSNGINNDRLARIRKRKRPEIVPTRGDREKYILYENQHQKLADTVTPLHSLQYKDQLNLKYKQNRQILREYGGKLKLAKAPIKRNGAGLPCKLLDIIPSPEINNYRNKDEFRIKRGVDGDIKTVGFLIGSMAAGTAICVNPTRLINIKSSHAKLAMAFQDYIRKSPLPVCDLFHDGGHWRGITARSNLNGDLMGIVVLHPQNMSQDDLEIEKNLLTDYFQNGAGAECNLHSLYFQACRQSRCTNEDAPYHLLFGQQYLYEELLGLKFRISPDAFFQVNTLGAACLYKTIQQLGEIDENTIVLDICSGIGTVGLLLASRARAVFGIELIEQAVEDAKFNAKLNNIKNATFYQGRAEKVLPQIKFDSTHKVVAVVNPGRSGLHPAVVKSLRSCKQVEKVIYIACNPRGEITTSNIINFGKYGAKRNSGQPLVPKVAVPMDMFPHTEHCELVVVLERCNE